MRGEERGSSSGEAARLCAGPVFVADEPGSERRSPSPPGPLSQRTGEGERVFPAEPRRTASAHYARSCRRLGALAHALCLGAALLFAACGGQAPGGLAAPNEDEDMPQKLADDEVRAIMQHAAHAVDREMAVAVTDRRGVILGVATNFADPFDYDTECATACPGLDEPASSDCAVVDRAIQLARTAGFFSADQTPLTSRSVRFLSGEHFPPSVKNTGAAALFGIENTNRGCAFDAAFADGADFLAGKVVPRARNLSSLLRVLGGAPALSCENPLPGAPDPAGARCGCTDGIATLPGGVPIYKNGRMAGGIGVAIRGVLPPPDAVAASDAPDDILRKEFDEAAADVVRELTIAEFAARAFAGDNVGLPDVPAKGLGESPVCNPPPGIAPPLCCPAGCDFNILPSRRLKEDLGVDPVIFVDGIEIPEVAKRPPVERAGGGRPLSEWIVDPLDPTSPDAAPVSSGWLVGPNDSTAGARPLSAAQVRDIIEAGIAKAKEIRAAIRLPLQTRTAMVLAVSDSAGALIGLYRMPDATVFSIDVAAAKARNVVYFSSQRACGQAGEGPCIEEIDTRDCPGPLESACDDPFFPADGFPPGTAITNRTLSFAAQPFFPSGIERTLPGPFRRVFVEDSATPCTNGRQPDNGRQNGIVFFPGSAPLYRDGVLVGGFGVSGDGVEQDDIVTEAGTRAAPGFEPPSEFRADHIKVRDVRLPYLKFNRNPGE